jgi:iron complex outermembrane receptor protein
MPAQKIPARVFLLALVLVTSLAAQPGGPPVEARVALGVLEGRVANAVTGAYLNHARMAVRGTGTEVLTDEAGFFRIVGLPPGEHMLEIYYTGLDRYSAVVKLEAGRVTEHQAALGSAERYGGDGKVVTLDAFKAAVARDMDSETIAINEQRFAPNLKNVIAIGSIGEPMGGSMGDFLRFLPGVAADYTNSLETMGVMIRGFPSNYSLMSVDGAQFAGSSGEGGREFDASRISSNAFSRVEVTKVPLPSTPADTMAGSINMVTKSAFERSSPAFRYRVGVASTDEHFSLKKTPSPRNAYAMKIYPDLFAEYTLPYSNRLGFVVTAQHSITANQTDQAYTEFRGVGIAGSAVTPAAPALNVVRENDRYRENTRASLSLRVDWRPSPNGVLSFSGLVIDSRELSFQSNNRIETGTNGRPSVTTGVPFSFTAENVEGATGRGGFALNYNHFEKTGLIQTTGVRYRLDDGIWRIRGGLNLSRSRAVRTDVGAGFFQNVTILTREQPVRVAFLGIRDGRPADFRVYNNANQPVDVFDLNNLVVSRAADGPDTLVRRDVHNADLSVRREIRRFRTPLALEIGGLQRVERNDDRRFDGRTYDYMGRNGSFAAAPFRDDIYVGQRAMIIFPAKPAVPWISTHKALAAFREDPRLFQQTVAQQRTTEINEIVGSKYIQESVTAAYLQGEAKFMENRLGLLGGVRFERTSASAEGPFQDPDAPFLRNGDGSFVRNAAGARVRKPEAGAAGSLEEVSLVYRERGATAERSYRGFYPSLHLNYNVTSRVLFRLAYAKTYGRPNYSEIIPNTVVDQDDDDTDIGAPIGRINLTNPGLKPWTADNYDASVEYYSDSGGLLSAGVFLKDVRNFFGRFVQYATENDLRALGLDPRYLGGLVTTQFNAGDARVRGVELNLRHSLLPFGGWGRHVSVFANPTRLETEGDLFADFRGFLPRSTNWGFIVSKDRLSFLTKWNHRGQQKRSPIPAMGPDAFNYAEPRLQVDVNVEWRLSKRLTTYLNIRNLTAQTQR